MMLCFDKKTERSTLKLKYFMGNIYKIQTIFFKETPVMILLKSQHPFEYFE